MQGYQRIRAVKVKAAKRKLARKKARWHDKMIARHGCTGGGYGRRSHGQG